VSNNLQNVTFIYSDVCTRNMCRRNHVLPYRFTEGLTQNLKLTHKFKA